MSVTHGPRNKPEVEPSHRPPITAGPVFVTRRATFSASHRLFNPDFSAEENDRVFGICNNLNGHGHNYFIEVTVKGEPDPATGMVVNLRDLKRVIEERILEDCDHRHLNLDVPWLEGVIPTAENLAVQFWRRLEPHVSPARLHRLRLYESDDNMVEYLGPKGGVPGAEP
jgi:6-pyruvoyltetrahydropterin/6-carboxytetrahydropterin synthase